jgi:hypothetical protein
MASRILIQERSQERDYSLKAATILRSTGSSTVAHILCQAGKSWRCEKLRLLGIRSAAVITLRILALAATLIPRPKEAIAAKTR